MLRSKPMFAAAALSAVPLVLVLASGGALAARSNENVPRVVFVARNDVPFDSLAAGPIAALMGAPIVITSPAPPLADAAAAVIADLDPELVIIAGGTAAVSPEVEAEIEDVCDCPAERAAGAGRNETAQEIAQLLDTYGLGQPLQTGAGVEGDATLDGTFFAEGLDVRGEARVGPLDVDGDAVVDGHLDADSYQGVEQPGTTSCAGPGFVPGRSDGWMTDNSVRGSTVGQLTFQCSLSLPHGAVIGRFEVRVRDADADPNEDIESCALYRVARDPDEGAVVDLMASVGGTEDDPGFVLLTTTDIDEPVVNATTHAYWITCTVNGTNADVGISAAFVDYTLLGLNIQP